MKTARSWGEAVSLLGEYGDEARILAGGQSLVPMMNLRLARPTVLVDVSDLDYAAPERSNGTVDISSLVRHRELVENRLIRVQVPLLSESARNVGNIRVRNRGTLGGTVAHGDASAEIPCALLALGAEISVLGPKAPRSIRIEDFFEGYFSTALNPDEVVTGVRVDQPDDTAGFAFVEQSARGADFATVCVAATLRLTPGDFTVDGLSLAIGGVADRPLKIEESLLRGFVGTAWSDDQAREIAAEATRSLEPPADVRASSEYRRRLSRVLVHRALTEAARKAARLALEISGGEL